MSSVSNPLSFLFRWLIVVPVLFVVKCFCFCFACLFGDLSVNAVSRPKPATTVQTLGNNPGGHTVIDIGPIRSTITTDPNLCDPSPFQSSITKDHTDPQTQHSPQQLVQTGLDTTLHPGTAREHAAQPSTHEDNTQAHPTDALGHSSEREESPTGSSTRASHGESHGDAKVPRNKASYWSLFFGNGWSRNKLRTVVPCWDLDHVTGEGSTCSTPSDLPSSLGRNVALKVMQRSREMLDMFMTNKNQHLALRAIHLIDHIIPLLHSDALLAKSLHLQAMCRYMLFGETRNISLLDQSIDGFQIVFAHQAWGTVNHGQTVVLCGLAFEERYRIKGDLGDLDRGIELLQEVLEKFAETANKRRPVIVPLGNLLMERYRKRWDEGDLNDAIDLMGEALSLLTVDEPNRPVALNNLGNALTTRYKKSGKVSDLEEAIVHQREALSLLSDDDTDRLLCLINLATTLITRYEGLGRISDVEEAIVLQREALSLLSGSDPDRPLCLDNLASALITRFERLGSLSDVEEAIVHSREALSLRSDDDPNRSSSLNSLAIALVTRYVKVGRISDVEEAIHHHREALSLRPGDHPDRSTSLNNLGSTLITRYKTLGRISDVEEAIAYHREALSLRSGDYPDQPLYLNFLAVALLTRYDRLGRIPDVEEAIVHHREALSLRSGNHPDRPESLDNLAGALTTRYKRLGRVSDVEEAIAHHREALSLRSGDHPGRSVCLINLASTLITRYERLGRIPDVEEAIVHHREALSLLSDSHPERSSSLSNLAIALITRYERLGRISDVEEAIVYHREALSLRSGDHPERPTSLNNLAAVLKMRYARLGDTSDLEEAIGLLEEACNISNPDDPRQWAYILNLAGRLLDRGVKGDLDRAIGLYKKALSLQPGEHPGRPITLEHLGSTLLQREQDASDIETGMRCIDEAFSLFPSNSPARQTALRNFLLPSPGKADPTVLRDRCIELAKLTPPENVHYSEMTLLIAPILHDCHETASELLTVLGLDPSLNAEDATLALLQKGSRSKASPASDQLRTTCRWITSSESFNRPRSLEMYALMLEYLDLAIARGPSLDLRRQRLSDNLTLQRAKDMVSDAVAFAIEQQEIETAVEFFERGRSILLAQLSLYRINSGLEAVAPDLATRFKNLSWEVESATFTGGKGLVEGGAKNPFEDSTSRAERLRREWEEALEEIRALDGFQQFLRPTPFVDLQKAAADGPVILLNISDSRSDAVIVFSHHPPTVVPLPETTPADIDFLVNSFKVGNDPYGPLRSLWEEVVAPIVSTLDTMEGAVPKSKRIWWCPAGPLTTLPLHAAGDYIDKRGSRLPDLYISSYTPTLSALSRARQDRSERSGMPNVLLVSQPNTPGQKPLPGVPEEISRVKERIPHAKVIEDELGTCNAVLSAVTQHQWVHFACHGNVEPKNPLQSHFALHDGPLPLVELMQNRLPLAELAVLSCCHSASGDSIIPDEFLHLAAGMQFAGFKSVVGTMWAMNDAVGPELADEFYRRLLKKGKGDYRQSAKVLNDTSKVLRIKKMFFLKPLWLHHKSQLKGSASIAVGIFDHYESAGKWDQRLLKRIRDVVGGDVSE